MGLTILRSLNLLLVALLAGTSFGIWMGFDPKGYSAATYVEQQQQMTAALNALLTALAIFSTLLTCLSAYAHRWVKRDMVMLLAAAFFLLVCILISALGNKPINDAVMTWTATPPENWSTLRDQWWVLHILRTIAELIALVLIIWTYVGVREKKSTASKTIRK